MAILVSAKVVFRASRHKHDKVGLRVGVVTVWAIVVLATPTDLLLNYQG